MNHNAISTNGTSVKLYLKYFYVESDPGNIPVVVCTMLRPSISLLGNVTYNYYCMISICTSNNPAQ